MWGDVFPESGMREESSKRLLLFFMERGDARRFPGLGDGGASTGDEKVACVRGAEIWLGVRKRAVCKEKGFDVQRKS